jgi:hypothetical protein
MSKETPTALNVMSYAHSVKKAVLIALFLFLVFAVNLMFWLQTAENVKVVDLCGSRDVEYVYPSANQQVILFTWKMENLSPYSIKLRQAYNMECLIRASDGKHFNMDLFPTMERSYGQSTVYFQYQPLTWSRGHINTTIKCNVATDTMRMGITDVLGPEYELKRYLTNVRLGIWFEKTPWSTNLHGNCTVTTNFQ